MRKRLMSILSAISPTCRESVRLMSEARDHPLSLSRRMGLRIHLMLCGFCRRYKSQIEFLKTALKVEATAPSARLSGDAKARMKERLDRTSSADEKPSRKDSSCHGNH